MVSIPVKIQEIIDTREKERLPIIQKKIEFIGEISHVLQQLKDFQQILRMQEQSGSGNLIPLLEHVPEVVQSIKELNINRIADRVESFKKEMERLKKRFGRKNIQIALIGYARQGKSTFLQQIAGLGDDVIPTSSLTDCTGAISIISNVDGEGFRMRLDYYTPQEFIKVVNGQLKVFFGDKLRVHTLEDLKQLRHDPVFNDSEEFDTDLKEKIETFFHDYILKLDVYEPCLFGKERTEFDSEEHVIEYVAKYKKFYKGDIIPDKYNIYDRDKKDSLKVLFNKYVAVKAAYIYKKFPEQRCGKIVMVDTIGLGNLQTEEEDARKMYDVLKQDSDIAIFNVRVPAQGGNSTPSVETKVLNNVFSNLDGYCPEKWIVANLNVYSDNYIASNPEFDTEDKKEHAIEDYKSLKNTWKAYFSNHSFGSKEGKKGKLAYAECANAMVAEEVRDNMLIPVLNIIKDNIDDIDRTFMLQADDMAKTLYYEYCSICETIEKAFGKVEVSNSQFSKTFRENYKALRLRNTLENYVKGLFQRRNMACHEVIEEIKPQISGIMGYVPSQETIKAAIIGMRGEHLDIVYHHFCDDVVAKILSSLKKVSASAITKVEEEVKKHIASILFQEGKLGCIKLKAASNAEPSQNWMRAFCNERLNGYNALASAFKSVLDFRMNIDGFLYAKCVIACQDLMDYSSIKFPVSYTDDEGTEFIWQEIRSSVRRLRSNLCDMFGIVDSVNLFGKQDALEVTMPNLLVWCMADTFKKELLNTNDGEDLEDFYYEYATVIWNTEIRMQERLGNAMESIIQLNRKLNAYCDQSYFTLIENNK